MGVRQTPHVSPGRDRRIRWRLRCAGIGVLASVLVVPGVAVTVAMADSRPRVIETTSGPVRGLSSGVVNKFQGIRYAKSPGGANRWTPPTAPARSHTVFDATTPGSPCPQQVNQFSPPPPFSEDCLFLNVTTPVRSDGDDDGLPVWIFIHGGALVTGTGAAFDPSVLVSAHRIIVVTINYRLGALGWLANPSLDGNGTAGNYGLMDQQLAFKWVRDNIEHFGGNPNRVTIGGESAGGLSTSSNLASPTAKRPFHAAIIESGAYMLFTVRPVAAQEALGAALATASGCPGADALAKVVILVALYPRANFANPGNNNKPSADEALSQIFTDITFTCRGLGANQLLARFVPVHAYEFADPNAPDLFQPLIGFSYGASHAAELQYLFDAKTLQGPADAAANAASPAPGAAVQPPPLTAGGQQLAAEMKGYWANFVRFHDPNGRREREETA